MKRHIKVKIKKRLDRYTLNVQKKGSTSKILNLRFSEAIWIILGSILFFIIIGILSVKYTPIERLVATNEYQLKTALYKNAILIDSLENILHKQERQCNRLLVLLGNKNISTPNDTIIPKINNSQNRSHSINYVRASADSLLRASVENEEQFNITYGKSSRKAHIFNLFLYPPINNGAITAIYQNTNSEKFGIDITVQDNAHIMATAEGVIISTEWSIEDGYKIIIQHENNLLSCYSYNTILLKHIGDTVKRGEAIAIIENTEDKTTMPLLHFELWHEGKPLNPKDFISF